jgi:5-methylcytosine-specific restriction enzyme subunit McrC
MTETFYEYQRYSPAPADIREALERHYGERGVPYYSLISRGVQFNQYVGILQVGSFTIEVLPKIDRIGAQDYWRKVLIDMLRKVEGLDLKTTENADLRLKPNCILDLYMELFVNEVAYLMHNGLTKSYRKTEGNRTALKGRLVFAQQIQQNLVHAERFYVRHTTYDRENTFNRILYKALRLLARICTHPHLRGRITQLLLEFPELPDINVSEAVFHRLPWSRKTEGYRKAIGIARLLLLNYHPDIRGGQEDVLALMFDMNKLWERYILMVLRRAAPVDWTVERQSKDLFWHAEGFHAHLKPDIVLRGPEDRTIVMDTKWKLLDDNRPSDQDLRQLFAYQHQWKAAEGYLVYPDRELHCVHGKFNNPSHHCHILGVNVLQGQQLNPDLGQAIWTELLQTKG